MASSITFDILAKDRASKVLNKVGVSADKADGKLRKLGKAAVLGLATGLAGAAVAAVKFSQAAVDDQKSAMLMARQFRNSAGATKEQIAATETWISKQGLAKGVADDDLRPALSRLVTATHDVGKAQKLASLAMDVSAGTGKDLQTVAMALMKAQNGQVTGLSRLGIATKNAKGDTLKFSQLQERLAKQFKGASTVAANTMSGKMDRLKIALSETGEAIGYKILPSLVKFGDYMVSKGIPAIEKAGSWVSKNLVPPMRELGEEVGGEVVPAVQRLAPVLKSVFDTVKGGVDTFTRLPGPLKSLAVSTGIAALAFPRLAAGAGSALGMLQRTGAAASLAGTQIRTAAGRSEMLAANMGRLKSGAGIAGMVALGTAAQTTSGKLRTLTTIGGGALLGFSAGGPIGAAIGGGAAALWSLWRASTAANRAISNGKAPLDSLRDSLDKTTGATTRLTRARQDQALRDQGAYKTLDKAKGLYSGLAVSQKDLLDASMGLPGAQARVAAAFRESSAAFKAQNKGLAGDAFVNVQNYDKAIGSLSKTVGVNAGQLRKSQREAAATRVRMGQAGKATHVLANDLNKVGTTKPKFGPFNAGVKAGMNAAKGATRKGASDIAASARAGTSKARANLGPFRGSLAAALGAARGTASSGGHSVGSAIGAGVKSGISGWIGSVASAAASLVQSAVNAAKARAKIKSPSQVMRDEVGKQLGLGVSIGIDRTRGLAGKSGTKLIKATIAAAKAAVKQLKTDRAELAGSFASGFGSSIFGADLGESGTTSVGQILADQANKRNAAIALQADVRSVIGKGLSKALVKQMIDAGDSGRAQLHALAGGDAGSIAQLNTLDRATTASLSAAGTMAAKAAIPSRTVTTSRGGTHISLVFNESDLSVPKMIREIERELNKLKRTRGQKGKV